MLRQKVLWRSLAVAAIVIATLPAAMAIDLEALWDFDKPALSEQRFRDAAVKASADDKLILETQIARTFGLRGDFAKARETLAVMGSQLPAASAEVNARYHLELGRTYASPAHPPAARTSEIESARVSISDVLSRLPNARMSMMPPSTRCT